MDAATPARPIAIVGAGQLGTVLAVALQRAGHQVVAVSSRSFASARRLAQQVAGTTAYAELDAAAQRASVVFLTVPDDATERVAAEIHWRADQLAVHCSGALPASILDSARAAGASVAGFHPLQSFADVETGLANLSGSWIGIEAEGESLTWLETVAGDLGAHSLRITPGHRARYHLGAVLTSNLTVGLVALAAELWAPLGVARADAVAALQPLLAGTARNVGELGIPAALTGPVVRGDWQTVERHLEALANEPDTLAIYRVLSEVLVGLAEERSTINGAQASAMRALLALGTR